MAAVTICSDFCATPKINSATVSTVFPSICHEVNGKYLTKYFKKSKIMASNPLAAGKFRGKSGSSDRQIFSSFQEINDKPTQCVGKQRHSDKGSCSQGYVTSLPTAHVQLWELDHKEGGTPKNWCFRTVVLEETPESPLDSKEIKLVNLKGDQPWIFPGRADAKAAVFWASDVNSWLIGKDPDARKDRA